MADTAKARRRSNSARRAEETRWCLEQRLKSRFYPEIARASATDLFLVAIAQRFEAHRARVAIGVIAIGVLTFVAISLVQLPRL